MSPGWIARPLGLFHGRMGLGLVVIGEMMIALRDRPISDFYFPVVWLGLILLLDSANYAHSGRSLFMSHRGVFLALFPMSAGFWWLFELFNVDVQNWTYIGGEAYTGLGYVAIASLDFSFVLAAVWEAAQAVRLLLPAQSPPRSRTAVPTAATRVMLAAAVLSFILPVALPREAFGLIWVSLFFLLDPINYRLGRPSIVRAVFCRDWFLPLSLALGALTCGFFWEAWNYWSMPKWVYHLPYIGFWHIFEMPLIGWVGYLPFGLELFAMTNFVLPLMRMGTLTLHAAEGARGPSATRQAAS